MGDTTIRVPEELADELYAMKGRGESYADVIRGLLEARERLAELEQRVDELESGGPSIQDESQRSAVDEPPETSTRTASRPRDPKGEGPEDTIAEPPSGDIEDILADWPPQSEQNRAERRKAATAALEWLRDEAGVAGRPEFVDALFEGYVISGQSEDTWWRKTIRPALMKADEAGIVEFHEGRWDYEWVGTD